jgi:hypothetical protein
MRAITGVFENLESAIDASRTLVTLLSEEHVSLLTPGHTADAKRLPTTDDMTPVGGPMGALLGGGLGFGTVALLAIPGVGPVVAIAAGAIGAALGFKVGDASDRHSSTGIPKDELLACQKALKAGHSCVVVLVTEKERAKEHRVGEIIEANGGHVDETRDLAATADEG